MNKFAMRSDKPTNQHKNRITVGGVFDIDKSPAPVRVEEPVVAKAIHTIETLQDEQPQPEPVVVDLPTVVSLPPPKKQVKPQPKTEEKVDATK
jgi:hypothetical protein